MKKLPLHLIYFGFPIIFPKFNAEHTVTKQFNDGKTILVFVFSTWIDSSIILMLNLLSHFQDITENYMYHVME